jgi:hypothetical protein
VPVQLYDVEGADPTTSPVQRVQWLSYGTGPGQLLVQGHKILIVDEVGSPWVHGGCRVEARGLLEGGGCWAQAMLTY